MAKLLTTTDLAEVVGIRKARLLDWMDRELLVPTDVQPNGVRLFSVPTAVGLCIADCVRKGSVGCSLAYVKEIIAAFSRMTEAELLEQFDAGRTEFHLGSPEVLVPPGDGPGRVDVGMLYFALQWAIRLAEENLTTPSRGQPRGLAKAR